MADYSVSCNGCEANEDGRLYTIPVYHDGESFYSYVFEELDVSGQTRENERNTLFEQPVWFTDIWRAGDNALFVTDADGRVHVGDGTAWNTEAVTDAPLNTVWGFGRDQVYAGGDDGIVYLRGGAGWQAGSPPLGSKILCIRGNSPSSLYAAGEDALFWHFDGSEWTPIELPTNAILVGLLCVGPVDVIVCGQEGALFRGAGEFWRDLSQPGKSFYKIIRWRDRILIAGGADGVLEFDGATVTAIKDNITVYRIAGLEQFLTVAGGNLAARFDGVGWFGARYA